MALKDILQGFNRLELQTAQSWNDRISFYSEIHSDITTHPYYPTFRKHLLKIYNDPYKVDRFIFAYMGSNTPTVEISETIFDTLQNVFESQNSDLSAKVKDKDRDEINQVLKQSFEYFKLDGWESLKTKFNSFLVVDIDEDGKPYYYNVLPEYVYYYSFDGSELKEIIFSFDKEHYYYYTDEFYSVYIKDKQGVYSLQSEPSKHNLGSCPVSVFLERKLNSKSQILRQNQIVPQADLLNKYTRFFVELDKIETLSTNYDKVIPSQSCGYETTSNFICKGGRMYQKDSVEGGASKPQLDSQGFAILCPSCGINKHVGAGSVHVVDFEALTEQGIDITNLISYIAPPLDSTEYLNTKVPALKEDIIKSSVGVVKSITTEARNETDINSDYESQQKIITAFGESYSKTITWALNITLGLVYGAENVEFINVFLGNKHFLVTKEILLDQKAKATNAVEKDIIQKQIFAYDFKNNPEKLRAITEFYKLLPYSALSDSEFLEYVRLGNISPFDIELRTNFNKYLNEFQLKTANKPELFNQEFIKKIIEPLVQANININKSLENGEQTQTV